LLSKYLLALSGTGIRAGFSLSWTEHFQSIEIQCSSWAEGSGNGSGTLDMQFKFNFTHKQPSEGAKKKEEQVGYMVDLSSELPAFMTIPKHKWVSFDLVRTCSSKRGQFRVVEV